MSSDFPVRPIDNREFVMRTSLLDASSVRRNSFCRFRSAIGDSFNSAQYCQRETRRGKMRRPCPARAHFPADNSPRFFVMGISLKRSCSVIEGIHYSKFTEHSFPAISSSRCEKLYCSFSAAVDDYSRGNSNLGLDSSWTGFCNERARKSINCIVPFP